MDIEFKPATFTAAEIEAITGVSGVQQRNLRRHGYLPQQSGARWTRYELTDAGKLFIMGKSERLGITPSTATKITDFAGPNMKSAAQLIVALAAQIPAAVSDPDGLSSSHEAPIKISPGGLSTKFLIFASAKGKLRPTLQDTVPNSCDVFIGLNLQTLAKEFVDRAGPLWTIVEAK